MAAWRRLVAAASLVSVLASGVTVAMGSAPAVAAPYGGLGEIVVDEPGGQVLVTEEDEVGVYDLDGRRVDALTGFTSVSDLVLRGRTLYVVDNGASRIVAVDVDTLAVTRTWSTAPVVGPVSAAYGAGRLWITHGDNWSTLAGLDLTTGAVVQTEAATVWGGGDIAASDTHVWLLARNSNPVRITTWDITGATPTYVSRPGPVPDSCGNGRELVVDAVARRAWTACAYPYRFDRWDLATNEPPAQVTYPGGAYPIGIAVSPDGGTVVGTMNRLTDNLRVYDADTGAVLRSITTPVRAHTGMVATTRGAGRVYVGTEDGGLRTYALAPVVTAVRPASVPRRQATDVTVVGTGLTEVTSATLAGQPVPFRVPPGSSALVVTVPAGLPVGPHPLVLTNRWGTNAAAPASVEVVDPAPAVPGRPTAESVGPFTVTVTWPEPPSGSVPPTGYRVTAQSGQLIEETQTVADRTATFSGLGAEAEYTFTVEAVGPPDSAASEPSEPVEVLGPDVRPWPGLQAFVAGQFLAVVGRPPGEGEAWQWYTDLRRGQRRPADLVAALRASSDNLATVDPVARLYRAYFLRSPDAGGFAHWVGQRRAGRSVVDVSRAFAASPEFRTMYGPLGNRAFVERVYRNVLGRPGDRAGIDFWTAQLDTGRRNRGAVMVGFSESAENKVGQAASVTSDVLHLVLLGRRPTAAERTADLAAIARGATVADRAEVILVSDEYRRT